MSNFNPKVGVLQTSKKDILKMYKAPIVLFNVKI